MNNLAFAPLLLVFPMIGVIFNGWFGYRFVRADAKVGERWAGFFSTGMAFISFIIAVIIWITLVNDPVARTVPLFDWFNIQDGLFRIQWAFYLDTLSSTMLLVITGVGTLIHIYAIGYMHGDKEFARFFSYLNLFLFFMIILVTGSSYLMLFVGWEGVGLCSFLLIGFWFDKPDGVGWANSMAARKAFVANRVGDFAMILAMIMTYWVFQSLDYEVVFKSAAEMFRSGTMVELPWGESAVELGSALKWITFLFLVGAAGKSAQIPLFIWLPDAMAGPTPVSALIHAATMVTSGIYLITRSNVLFEIVRASGDAGYLFGNISTPDLVAIVGACTALYAGLVAFTQNDVKKVLAYSTVSQLGFMIAAVGMGSYIAGMFHLITHAFFKALLFMGSGSIIHGMEHGHHHLHDHHDDHGHDDGHGHDEHLGEDHHDDFDPQDMRTMGGLRHKMPTTFWTYMVGSLALAGIFPLAGFWSKDEILATVADNPSQGAVFTFVGIVLSIAAFCTAFYMTRQVKMVFFGEGRHEAVEHVPESNGFMTFPLVVLSIMVILGAFINLPIINFGATADEEHSYAGALASVVTAEEEESGLIPRLALEKFLIPSIDSYKLTTKEGLLEMPKWPTVLNWQVAIQSSIIAIAAIILGWFFYSGWSKKDPFAKDRMEALPVIGSVWLFFQSLPFDRLAMDLWVERTFKPIAALSDRIDWDFWHDYFHNNLIRDSFIAIADVLSNSVDPDGVDGVVNGVGKSIRSFSTQLRRIQTGNVGNYALSLFIGVTVLVVYFIFAG